VAIGTYGQILRVACSMAARCLVGSVRGNGIDRFFRLIMARSLLVESLLSFLLLIAIADPDASAVANFARNRKRKRAITKVVCFSVSRHLFGKRAPFCLEQIGEALGDFAIYSACRAGVAQW
jgi:hypothetical protein